MIIFVPKPGHAALIAPSFPCARVPTVYRAEDWAPPVGWRPGEPSGWTFMGGGSVAAWMTVGWRPGEPSGWTFMGGGSVAAWMTALVLVHNGAAVAEGCDRLRRYLGLAPLKDYDAVGIRRLAETAPDVGHVLEVPDAIPR